MPEKNTLLDGNGKYVCIKVVSWTSLNFQRGDLRFLTPGGNRDVVSVLYYCDEVHCSTPEVCDYQPKPTHWTHARGVGRGEKKKGGVQCHPRWALAGGPVAQSSSGGVHTEYMSQGSATWQLLLLSCRLGTLRQIHLKTATGWLGVTEFNPTTSFKGRLCHFLLRKVKPINQWLWVYL